MNPKKKLIFTILIALLIVLSVMYLRSESNYEYVSKEAEKSTQVGTDERTPEEIGMDRKIAKQREKNRRDWLKDGITGSLPGGGRGKHVGPKNSKNSEYIWGKIVDAVHAYMESKPDIYPPIPTEEELYYNQTPDAFTDVEQVEGPDVDTRISYLIAAIPVEQRKPPVEGYEDENIAVMEARRLDGTYDDLVLVKEEGQEEWKVVFAGTYYEFRDLME